MELTKTKKFNLILGLSASIALSGCQGLGGACLVVELMLILV